MKIVILDAATVTAGDINFDLYKNHGDLVIYNSTSSDEIIPRIGDAEIVLCNKSRITEKVMRACPSLRFVGLFATGYNNIDSEFAAANGITVSNAPGYSTDAVAQFTFSLILEHYSRVGEYSASVSQGNWVKAKQFSYFLSPLRELAGQTIGLIGFGSIGRRVAEIAHAFAMDVLVFTRTPKPEYESDRLRFVSFDELLEQSDIVSVHCPLTEQTRGMLDACAFSKMKPSSYVINTARGPVVDEQALADALNSGKVAGAGLDVVSIEPMREDNPLISAKNCIITPHIAWAPKQTRERLVKLVDENITAYLKGAPINVVK